MNKYVYGLVLTCALLSSTVNAAAPNEQDDVAARKAAYIAKCKAEGADKREARRVAREAKEAAQKAKDATAAKEAEGSK